MGTTEKYPVKRIVILGANGQIGSRIYHYLKQHFPARQITACVRQLPHKAYPHDYTVFNPFTDNWQSLGEADVLINCIGIIQETKNVTFEQAHVGLTRLMVQHRQTLSNPKMIQISALGANKASPAAFLATKAIADDLLLTHPRTVVVKPSIVCTPDTVFAQKLKLLSRISRYLVHRLPFPEHLLQTQIQPVLPEDLAALVAKLCFTDEHAAIISAVGPEIISLQELIHLSDKRISLIPIPKAIAHAGIKLLAGLLPDLINRQQYELLLRNNTASKQAFEKLLGKSVQSTKLFWQNNA